MSCVVCGGSKLAALVEISQAPVFINQLCDSERVAREAPVGLIDLVGCADCGHVFNRGFDAALLQYSPEYENSLHFSAQFQSYAEDLSAQLRRRYALDHKRIVEVGCGSGDFLRALCREPTCRGFGFDRSYPGEQIAGRLPSHITIKNELFSDEHRALGVEFLCCRHVLEHIDRPVTFLQRLRSILGDDIPVYFEVPNALFTLEGGGIWDIIYEHCSYFTPSSLAAAFQSSGFQVLEVTPSFGGQFLSVHARTVSGAPTAVAAKLGNGVEYHQAFRSKFEEKKAHFAAELSQLQSNGKRAVIWGAGSKGSTFLNWLSRAGEVTAAVDLNPRKQGKYVAGSAQRIVAPGELPGIRPDVVVVMNPMYAEEIGAQLKELGLDPRLIVA